MAVALVLWLGAVLGACGGDDGGGRLSAEAFAARANETCTELQDEVEATFADLPPDGEPALYQGVIKKLVPLVDGGADDLDELQPPADIEARFDEALAAMRAGNDKVREASQSPEAAAAIFATDRDPYDDANAIFDELGLTECGSGGTDDAA